MSDECGTQRATKARRREREREGGRVSRLAVFTYVHRCVCVCACVYLTAKSSTCDMHGTKSKFNDQVK